MALHSVRWFARCAVSVGVATALVVACGDSSTRNDTASGGGGGGQSGSPASGGSAVAGGGAAAAGSAMGGNEQGGFGGIPPQPSDGGAPEPGGEAGQGGVPSDGGAAVGGAAVGGAGGESAEGGASGAGGAEGTGGAGERCGTAPAEPHPAACAVLPSVTQEYRVGLATEQLSFGVRLRATGWFGGVYVNEVEVHYYYSQEETSGFQTSVDSFVLEPMGIDLTESSEISIVALDPKQNSTSGPGCQTHFIRIRNSSTVELPADEEGETYAELHVTLTPNNPAAPNQNHADDHSYVAEATDWDQTSRLGVYHCGGLTSGCTPGDAGTCN